MHHTRYILLFFLVSISIAENWEYSADKAEIKKQGGQQIKQFTGNVVMNKGSLQLFATSVSLEELKVRYHPDLRR